MELLCISAGAVAALFALGYLIRPERTELTKLIAALLGCAALALGISAARYRIDPNLALKPAPSFCVLALSGVLFFYLSFYLTKLETERRRFSWYPFLVVVPGVVSDICGRFLEGGCGGWAAAAAVTGLRALTGFFVVLCCAAALVHVFRYHFPCHMTGLAWVVLSSSGIGFIALLNGLVGFARGDARLYAITDAVVSILILSGAALSFRSPEAVHQFREETVRRRYARSTLVGLDVEELIDGMNEMVRSTALYRRPDCSLETLAKRMGLTRHQVSELLNERMGTNFTAFINRFRIEAARELLASRPELTVLAVALETGFGNKTSFNEAFKKSTGMTPSEYKKTVKIDNS
jgi:AraC-like DNA-binding protein